MLNVENDAMPLTAATVTVPLSVPPDGFVPIASVTLFVAVVTTAPTASTIFTCTAGEIMLPAIVDAGVATNCNAVATGAATVDVIEIDVTLVRPGALKTTGPVPLPST